MKQLLSVTRCLALMSLLVAFRLPLCAQSDSPSGLDIQKVVLEARTLFNGVESRLEAQHLPPLRQVKLSLQVVQHKIAPGVSVKSVYLAGTALGQDTTTQMDLLLAVPPHPPAAPAALSQSLSTAILNAALSLKNTLPAILPLRFTVPDVKVELAVNPSGDGVVLSPMALGQTGLHRMSLTFAAK